ncbi:MULTISPECIES: AI-2E family transporter [unclassified Ruegeria]|uniref:AI-2E family transporter n=1 Tax=unclassified Ruegeria TaxID=2625375 RepID=UPI001ADAC4C9|nr:MULTISPECIES: AI-2E family transporter [unclassified Ruegeria]MBO9410671.1 AI-2E family transporter [Ruegeria sp. R8_1]MBO9414110.1 AI-2E family transporter [Ruegeria sp. R8_2]
MTLDPENSASSPRIKLAVVRDAAIVATLTVLALYAGAAFLIPLTMALLINVLIMALSDRVIALTRAPVWLANIAGVTVVLAGLFMIMYILGSQATQFARSISDYESQFDGAVNRITGLVGNNVTTFIRDNLINIDMTYVARVLLGSATSLLNQFFLISLYVAFLMAERLAFRKKIRLAAGNPKTGAEFAAVLDAISFSLQRYVGVKTFISLITAGISYSVFRVLGLEYSETWAVLTFALNFIPSIGSIIAVVFPAMIALVQFDSVGPFLIIVLGCGTIQFAIGNFLDPAMLGRSLNMSTFLVILALTFWTTVWGMIGAFLSVPLTVCILIVFSHIPALRPIAVLMSLDGRIWDDQGNTET